MEKSGYGYLVGPKYDEAVAPVVAALSGGKKICDCFGLFKSRSDRKAEENAKTLRIEQSSDFHETVQPVSADSAKLFQYGRKKNLIKHDLVYVLGTGSRHKNLEIKISITSMLKFCSHWIGNIYVVGENPHIHNQKVKHVYAPDITKGNKDANIIHKLLTAIRKIPNLTDNFLFCSDDILVTRKSDWDDFAPRYVFEYRQNETARKMLQEESKDNAWDLLLLKTLDRFVGSREHIYFYEPHIFAPINKKYFQEMCR